MKNNVLNIPAIYLLTKNEWKILAAQEVFTSNSIKLFMLDKNYPEIQADTSMDVARYSSLMASKDNNISVIREDHSLYLHWLWWIPWPYTNFIERKISAEKLLEIIWDNREWYFRVSAV